MINNNNFGGVESIFGFDKGFKYSFYKYKAINLPHTSVKSAIYNPTNVRVKKLYNFTPYPLSYIAKLPK